MIIQSTILICIFCLSTAIGSTVSFFLQNLDLSKLISDLTSLDNLIVRKQSHRYMKY